jgi:hypothetical protein
MGLGGGDSWRSTSHAEHLIFPGDYRYGFTIMPLPAGADPNEAAKAIRR